MIFRKGSGFIAMRAINRLSPSRTTQGPRALPGKAALAFLPTLLAVVYFGLWASSQYVGEARFVLRGAASAPRADVLGALTGLPGHPDSLEDAYIVRDFILSGAALDTLRPDVPLTELYRRPGVDVFSRLKAAPTREELLEYWRGMVQVSVDKSTGILTLKAMGFTPQDALLITRKLLEASEGLVNGLSLRMRQDMLTRAEKEVALSLERVSAAREGLTRFRLKHGLLDPVRTAETRQAIVGKLEGEIVEKSAELAKLHTFMQPYAPQVTALEKRIQALQKVLQEESAKNASTMLSSLPDTSPGEHGDLVNAYRQLAMDMELAEKAYEATVKALEAARGDISLQHRYLAAFVEPRLPEEALLPRRMKSIATVLVLSMLAWGIGHLLAATIREHRQWSI